MCFQCDHPELTYADYLDSVILPLIHQYGWAVQRVSGRRPFGYAAGLTDCGLPELIVTGLRDACAASLLNDVAAQVLRADLMPGRSVTTAGLRLHVVTVDRPQDHLFTATALYGDGVRSLRLVWPDEPSCDRWEPGHRAPRGGQPLLGPNPGSGAGP